MSRSTLGLPIALALLISTPASLLAASFTPLGVLPGGQFTTAHGLSADGSTVVGNASLGAGEVGNEAFRWDAVRGLQRLGDLPGGPFHSNAQAISADGHFVVGHGRTERGPQAFRWDAVHGMRALGELPGVGSRSVAQAVSADGSTVVGYVIDDGDDDSREAFIWSERSGMQALDVVLASLGIDLNGWRLTDAVGISDDGRTIAGSGRSPGGRTEAWIAVVPEPGTAILLGLSLMGLAIHGRSASSVTARRRQADSSPVVT
ncbi:MAG: PEP-CTERM sorting domain-containing protein [Myxococcota bacterium]